MQKLVVILLFASYCASSSSLSQWLKLPTFVSHYNEHKAANSQLTIMEFLAMHYGEQQDHDARDKELPFKTLNDCCSYVSVYLPNTVIVLAESSFDFNLIHFGEYYGNKNARLYSPIVFQPPRV